MRSLVTFVLLLLVVPAAAQLPGFVLIGDPAADSGARWTYNDTISDTIYDLAGVLFKPAGPGPFPGVIVSHGSGGNAYAYSTAVALTMRPWGLVCIATNYTHAQNVPIGSPGDSTMMGACLANVQRGRKCWEILGSLGYVDTARIAAHGMSAGAFVTAALVGIHHDFFRVASHCAGGVRDSGRGWTRTWQAEGITAPYQIHHGDSDRAVPIAADWLLDSILAARGVIHELVVYPGYGHNQMGQDTTMFRRVREWYTTYGLFDTTHIGFEEGPPDPADRRIGVVPSLIRTGADLRLAAGSPRWPAALYDAHGRKVLDLSPGLNDLRGLAPGIYFVRERGVRCEGRATKIVVTR